MKPALIMAGGMNHHASMRLVQSSTDTEETFRRPCPECGDIDGQPIDQWQPEHEVGYTEAGNWIVVASCCGVEIKS